MNRLLVLIHLLAVIVWIGGMFFAHVCLRPVAAAQLQPPQRLPLLAAILGRFFMSPSVGRSCCCGAAAWCASPRSAPRFPSIGM
jgi:uncharacterized membrane protein